MLMWLFDCIVVIVVWEGGDDYVWKLSILKKL